MTRSLDRRGTIMIKVLEVLLGKVSRERPAKKSMPAARPQGSTATGAFRSVAIAPSIICCREATRAAEKCYLSREAPRLPLPGCTMPAECACKFRKKLDRREGDRRLFGATETNRWFAGRDNRKCASRRAVKA